MTAWLDLTHADLDAAHRHAYNADEAEYQRDLDGHDDDHAEADAIEAEAHGAYIDELIAEEQALEQFMQRRAERRAAA